MVDELDDLMGMENADLTATEATTEDTTEEAVFNEAELEDIMAEIDSLEQDFGTDTTNVVAETPQAEDPVIVVPVAAATEDVLEESTIAQTEYIEPTKVLPFDKKVAPMTTPTITNTQSNVSLSAQGSMTLNLAFKIGEEQATLVVDQEKGLLVSFSGVELCFHAEDGCTLKMANGLSLTIPVQDKTATTTKKAA
jgi:hypothetical protein